jgi:hypothetical protein
MSVILSAPYKQYELSTYPKIVLGNLGDFQDTRVYVEVKFHIQVLYYEVLLKGVPRGVTSVSKQVKYLVFPMCILPIL